jgi:hypothetical protein
MRQRWRRVRAMPGRSGVRERRVQRMRSHLLRLLFRRDVCQRPDQDGMWSQWFTVRVLRPDHHERLQHQLWIALLPVPRKRSALRGRITLHQLRRLRLLVQLRWDLVFERMLQRERLPFPRQQQHQLRHQRRGVRGLRRDEELRRILVPVSA